MAMDLVRELESYTGDPSNIVMSGTLTVFPRTSSIRTLITARLALQVHRVQLVWLDSF